MQDQLYSFLQMAPQLHLAAHVTCHLTAAVILSIQRQGPFPFYCYSLSMSYSGSISDIFLPHGCHYYECMEKYEHLPLRQGHGFWVSFFFDILSKCSATVNAGNYFWSSRLLAANSSLAWNQTPANSIGGRMFCWNIQQKGGTVVCYSVSFFSSFH